MKILSRFRRNARKPKPKLGDPRCRSCGCQFVPPFPTVETCIRCATRARGGR